jgi:hypothetical protein
MKRCLTLMAVIVGLLAAGGCVTRKDPGPRDSGDPRGNAERAQREMSRDADRLGR